MFRPTHWSALVLPVAFAVVLGGSPVMAEEPSAADEAEAAEETQMDDAGPAQTDPVVLPPTDAPPLGLDSLLRPRGTTAPKRTSFRAGKDREAWEQDFANARSEVTELQKQVDDLQQQIRETAQGDWNYTPTGGAAPTDPEVLRLRAQLKRDKRSLEGATTRLRDLEVEASLANVPDHWIDETP